MSAFDMTKEQFHEWFENLMFPTLPYRSIKKDYNISKNVNTEICSECKGECCKQCGCHFSPDDFKEISFISLKEEIEKGYISIDYVDGEILYESIGVYILRTRNQNAPVVDTGYNRSPCILLTENGCKLNYENRPSGGKLLIPSSEYFDTFEKKRDCRSSYSIRDCCYEWKPHQRVLHDLMEYFKDKYIECSI